MSWNNIVPAQILASDIKKEQMKERGWVETKGGWKKEGVFKDIPIPFKEAIEVEDQLNASERQGAIL